MKWYLEVNETDYETVELGDIAMSRWQTSPGMEQKSYYPKEEQGWIKYNPWCLTLLCLHPRRYRRENIDRNHTEATSPGCCWSSRWFSFEQSMAFHAALPIIVIAKCLVIDAPHKVLWRSFGGTQSLEAPPGLIYSLDRWVTEDMPGIQIVTSVLSALLIFKVECCPAVYRGHDDIWWPGDGRGVRA